MDDVGDRWIEESSRRKKDSSLQSSRFISQRNKIQPKGIKGLTALLCFTAEFCTKAQQRT